MKIIYAGYGIFGVLGLSKILSNPKNSVKDILVIDPKDSSPSAELINNYCKIFKIKKCNTSEITSLSFDIVLSVHWRKLLPKSLIEKAKYGGINLHPSLLPKFAGCSSLAWALIKKESKVGFTWHLLDSEFDIGDIVLQKEVEVLEEDNAFSLWNRVNSEGINSLNTCIDILISPSGEFVKQDLSQRTYYKRGFPDYDEIKKTNPSLSYERYLRASFFPGKD